MTNCSEKWTAAVWLRSLVSLLRYVKAAPNPKFEIPPAKKTMEEAPAIIPNVLTGNNRARIIDWINLTKITTTLLIAFHLTEFMLLCGKSVFKDERFQSKILKIVTIQAIKNLILIISSLNQISMTQPKQIGK